LGRKGKWEYFRVIYGRYCKADRKQGDAAQLSILKALRSSLDPFQLPKVIDRKLERIYRLANQRLRLGAFSSSHRCELGLCDGKFIRME
jgi:hypothetical protein